MSSLIPWRFRRKERTHRDLDVEQLAQRTDDALRGMPANLKDDERPPYILDQVKRSACSGGFTDQELERAADAAVGFYMAQYKATDGNPDWRAAHFGALWQWDDPHNHFCPECERES
jgi:hypothetical protein